MAQRSFSPIRKALIKHDRDALVSLIGELYALDQQSRDFLDARFCETDVALKSYKKIIREALYPEVMSSDPVSFRDVRKAIADYRKAIGETAGLAELFVYAAECGNEYTCDYGDIDEPFYVSLERMFEAAVKTVSALDSAAAQPFIFRLGAFVQKADGIGWGYHDFVAGTFAEAFPNAETA